MSPLLCPLPHVVLVRPCFVYRMLLDWGHTLEVNLHPHAHTEMQPVDCNHYGSFIPCSGILQPQSEQDLRQWSPCIGWSFGSEPEPSEARVSPATHVVEGLFIDSVCSCAFHKMMLVLDYMPWLARYLTNNLS